MNLIAPRTYLKILFGLFFVIACKNAMATNPSYNLCSFNIQFLGTFKIKENLKLAEYMQESQCDLVMIQELVAPPTGKHEANQRVRNFFSAMKSVGFASYWLSEEDTGRGSKNGLLGSSTEWHVVFYKGEKLYPAMDLPNGFLAEDVTAHPDYDRVPYAFSFRDHSNNLDFVLINVHLRPGASPASRARRLHELAAIQNWISMQKKISSERNFWVVGDMNIKNAKELVNIEKHLPLMSLNYVLDQDNFEKVLALPTNTVAKRPKPYDHFMVDLSSMPLMLDFEVLDLIEGMRPKWDSEEIPFPGDPYNHNFFRYRFSDHHPIRIKVAVPYKDLD